MTNGATSTCVDQVHAIHALVCPLQPSHVEQVSSTGHCKLGSLKMLVQMLQCACYGSDLLACSMITSCSMKMPGISTAYGLMPFPSGMVEANFCLIAAAAAL